jgi:hypothetical protein
MPFVSFVGEVPDAQCLPAATATVEEAPARAAE